jgi:hypothetical protein
MSEKKRRRGDSAKTDWKREPLMKKNATYEEKIRHLEYKIEELQSHIRLAEELLERRFSDSKKRPFELDQVIRLLKTDDGVSSWNWEDKHAVNSMAEENLLVGIQEFYEYLQGIKRPHNFADTLLMPELSGDMAWKIIYVLQEGLRVLPDHIERCDYCGCLFDTYNEGRYSELEGKNFCGGHYYEGETITCDECGEDAWNDKAWDEDLGQYLCDECKKKRICKMKKEPPVFIGCRIGCYNGKPHYPDYFVPPQAICPQANKCPHGTDKGKKWFMENKGVYQQ